MLTAPCMTRSQQVSYYRMHMLRCSYMKTVLLCLHGWGGSKESFTELRQALQGTDLEILTPDLPGFGAEPEPDRAWSTDDYADWVARWLRQRMENGSLDRLGRKMDGGILLLGHSHGGRIAIKLAARQSSALPTTHYPLLTISHLFLCAAAGIRHPRHFKRIIGLMLAKTGKFFLSIPGIKALQPLGKKFLYCLVRVHDYEKASPVMRETMIKVSAEDLTPLLSRIAIPTDIFWGTDDGMTPVTDAHLMKKLISQSKLHIFEGTRHGIHKEKATEIATSIRKNL